jgi:hypothetical protein
MLLLGLPLSEQPAGTWSWRPGGGEWSKVNHMMRAAAALAQQNEFDTTPLLQQTAALHRNPASTRTHLARQLPPALP